MRRIARPVAVSKGINVLWIPGMTDMKYESFNIHNKRAIQRMTVCALLLVLLGSVCNTISLKLQDEYIRPGLNPGMCGVFDKYRQSIPEIMTEDKVPGRMGARFNGDRGCIPRSPFWKRCSSGLDSLSLNCCW